MTLFLSEMLALAAACALTFGLVLERRLESLIARDERDLMKATKNERRARLAHWIAIGNGVCAFVGALLIGLALFSPP